MRFWEHGQKRPAKADDARSEEGVEYSAIALAVQREGTGYHLEIDLTLDAAQGSVENPLVLALNNCPFEIRSVNSGASAGSRVVSSAGREHMLLEPESELGWDKQVVHVVAFWQPVNGTARQPQAPWLIVPDMLPTPVLVGSPNAIRGQAHQPMITLNDELPDELDGGGIALARSMTNEPTVELLQSVIFPRLLLCDSRDHGRFTFISTDLRLKPELTVARALLAEMTEFLIGMFRVDPATRICVALTDDPFNGFGAPGALIPIRADWLGLGSNGHRYEHLIVRMLTGVWWGSGCRIRGEDSLPIYIAIGAAMGLLWLESRGVQDAVERLLAKHRTGPQGEATSNMTGALQVSALTVAFHRALREPRVAREFGRMTREYWAQSVSEEVWLRRLNACGIDLPDVLLGG